MHTLTDTPAAAGRDKDALIAALREEIELLHKSLAAVENAMQAQKETIALQKQALDESQAKAAGLEADLAKLKKGIREREIKQVEGAFKLTPGELERLDEA